MNNELNMSIAFLYTVLCNVTGTEVTGLIREELIIIEDSVFFILIFFS